LKRCFDLLLSGILLLLFALPMLALALILLFVSGRPIFFRQERPGKGGNIFKLLKFRTMRVATESMPESAGDSIRLTRFGLFLRSTSLDELPGLWNVFKGEMSLVGPRPLLVEYLPLYSAKHARRHEVRPGITGWAQVKGRNAISWQEKFDFDIWYVDHHSFWLDFKILSLTAWKVLAREGISEKGGVTMARFEGD
jgi:lipopolysaccharide/colanic/teichoic acid biosynthesis glycosyltransferase